MNLKKFLTIGFLAVGAGVGAYVATRKEEIESVVDKLKFKVKDVKNFGFSAGKLKADLYIEAINPTKNDISLNTGVLKADTLRVYEKSTNKLLAVSDLKLNQIEILSGGSYVFPKLEVKIPLITGAIIALTQLENEKTEFVERLAFELDMKALDYTQTIKF